MSTIETRYPWQVAEDERGAALVAMVDGMTVPDALEAIASEGDGRLDWAEGYAAPENHDETPKGVWVVGGDDIAFPVATDETTGEEYVVSPETHNPDTCESDACKICPTLRDWEIWRELDKSGSDYAVESHDTCVRCDDCGLLCNTQPSHMWWTPRYVIGGGKYLCFACWTAQADLESKGRATIYGPNRNERQTDRPGYEPVISALGHYMAKGNPKAFMATIGFYPLAWNLDAPWDSTGNRRAEYPRGAVKVDDVWYGSRKGLTRVKKALANGKAHVRAPKAWERGDTLSTVALWAAKA